MQDQSDSSRLCACGFLILKFPSCNLGGEGGSKFEVRKGCVRGKEQISVAVPVVPDVLVFLALSALLRGLRQAHWGLESGRHSARLAGNAGQARLASRRPHSLGKAARATVPCGWTSLSWEPWEGVSPL